MSLIYDIGIRFYRLIVCFVALFNNKARLWCKGQKNAFTYLESSFKKDSPIIWIHSASLGEFEQGRPLIEAIKKNNPAYKILLTFFSPSGYEIRKNYNQADYICYMPVDTKKNVRRFLELTRPEMAFFIKYEFWKNYIDELYRKDIPLYMVSAIFRAEQLFFKESIGARWYREVLNKVEHFFVQNKQSAELLSGIHLKNYTITGDTRFDRVAEIVSNPKKLELVEKFKGHSQLIVAGSTWQPDEKILEEYIRQSKEIKFVIAPHEIKEANIKRLLESFNGKAVRYSMADNIAGEYRILVIDSIGLLSSIYQYAEVAYIGGGFGVGIHNVLEAAIYDIPVLFGPNYLKFQEAVELVQRKLAFPVNNGDELLNELNGLLGNKKKLQKIKLGCHQFMQENLGATAKIMNKIFEK